MLFSEYAKTVLDAWKTGEPCTYLESSSERIKRIITTGAVKGQKYPFGSYPIFEGGKYPLHGLSDIKDLFVETINTCVVLNRRGQTPLILMHGPPSSGKTYLRNRLNEILVDDYKEHVRYTIEIKRDQEPIRDQFNVQPISLLSCAESFTPRQIQEQFAPLCVATPSPTSLRRYNDILTRRTNGRNLNDFDSTEDFLRFLDEYINIVPIFPQKGASLDITKVNLSSDVERIIQNANRNVLHCEINDAKIDKDIPGENYQTLLNFTDGNLNFLDGTSMKLDLVILLYTNWAREAFAERKPLVDRSSVIPFRRNLSWRVEEKILTFEATKFSHRNSHAFRGFTKATVATRLNGDILKDKDLLRRSIDDYALYEESKPGITSDRIRELFTRVRKPIQPPQDGWSQGLSLREALSELNAINPEEGECLRPSDVIKWLSGCEKLSQTNKDHSTNDIKRGCISDIAFLRVILHNGSIEQVDKKFSEYDKAYLASIQGKKEVYHEGAERPIEEVMKTLEEHLCITGMRSTVIEAINTFMNLQDITKKRRPTLRDIMSLSYATSLSSLAGTDTIIPWKKITSHEDLAQTEKEVISKLSYLMRKYLDCCEFCLEDVLKITAEEFGRLSK
ncbi:MAG: hypothetical protein AABW49_00530 [Nanoarchaeota archaeon]